MPLKALLSAINRKYANFSVDCDKTKQISYAKIKLIRNAENRLIYKMF